MEWQPIETAPKEEWVLVLHINEGSYPHATVRQYAQWRDGSRELTWQWVDTLSCVKPSLVITHWMPLPQPPTK